MRKRQIATVMLLLFFVFELSGCPGSGSPFVGVWGFFLDSGCDTMAIASFLIAIRNDGTAAYYSNDVYSGTWTNEGSTVTVSFGNVEGASRFFTGTLNNDVVINGTYFVNAVQTGCFTAQRDVS